MTSRILLEKTLNFDFPERIPRQIWVLPWAEENYPEEVKKLQLTYPDDIVSAPEIFKNPLKKIGDKYKPGKYIDEWGCKFSNVQSGVIGIILEPLIADWDDLEHFQLPEETLSVDKTAINAFCGSTEKFVLSNGAGARPFERLQFIRTMEQALIDLITEPPELMELLKRIHEHYCKEVEVWAQTEVNGIALMDDWGMQNRMLVPPEIFRRYFKSMYRDYVDIARQYGKYVFMHSDGYIIDIIPDLIEVGIDALNSQLFCMNIKELGDRFKGEITFWGEMDRQHLLPRGSKQDIKKAVHQVYDNLYSNGGVIAQCEFGPGAKPENVSTVFETWDSISGQLRDTDL